MHLTLSGRSFIKVQNSSFPLFPNYALQYYVKREKCKVNDVIFPSGCEAHAINLGNKNMTISIFTGATSERSKNIFTDISRNKPAYCDRSRRNQMKIVESSPKGRKHCGKRRNCSLRVISPFPSVFKRLAL